MKTMSFKIKSSRQIYTGRVFSLRSDLVEFPDGRSTSLDILEHGGAVVIVPRLPGGELVMIRQYRHPAQRMLLEFPAGTLEAGEDPLVCAQRELREETGFSAKKLEKIGGFYLAPGYSTEYLHIYFATDLESDPLPKDSDEWLDVELLSFNELLALIEDGALEDAKSVAAFYLALKQLMP